MTQLLHIFRKDVRRLRWWLAAWVVLLSTRTLAAIVGPPIALRGFAEELLVRQFDFIVALATALLLALTIARLVHEEPLVGLDWFWLTRPYDWLALLGAKLLPVLIVFVALPVAARLIVMATFAARPGDMFLAMPGFVATDMQWGLGLMVFAVLTRSLSRFWLAIVGSLAVVALALVVAIGISLWRASEQTAPDITAPVTDASGLIVLQAVVLLSAAGTIVFGYRTRRFAPTLVLAIFGIVAAFVTSILWPWPFAALRPSELQGGGLAASVKATLDLTLPPRIEQPPPVGVDRNKRVVTVPTRVDLPPEFRVQGTFTESRLSFKDGYAIASGQAGGLTTGVETTNEHPLQAIFAGVRVLPFTPGRSVVPVAALLSVTADDITQYRSLPGLLASTVFYNLTRSRIVAALPLTEGAAFKTDRFRIDILRVEPRLDACGVDIRRWSVSPMLAPKNYRSYEFVIRNSRKGEAIVGDYRSFETTSEPMPVLPFAIGAESAFDVSHTRIDYPAQQEAQSVMPTLDRQWLLGAELVVIETMSVGWIAKSATVENFQIRPTPAVTQSLDGHDASAR